MKGSTKIELTNVKTGEVKTIEKHNLVTNAISKWFESNFYCGYRPKNPFTNRAPIIDNVCGGLLLFKDAITENANNYGFPAGNKMIGNGLVNYATLSTTEFGSYNAQESAYSIDAQTGAITRRYVYDFTTQKANGQISCVALTNYLFGYFGCGNWSKGRDEATVGNINYGSYGTIANDFLTYHNTFPTYGASDIGYPYDGKCFFADYTNNCLYQYDKYALVYDSAKSTAHISNGTMYLYKLSFPLNKMNVMVSSDSYWRYTEKISITVPSGIASIATAYTQYHTICYDTDGIYIIFCANFIQPNVTMLVWKLSYDLQTSTVYSMTNTTGIEIFLGQENDPSVSVVDGYLYCAGYDQSRVFKIKISDSTDVVELTNQTNTFGYTKPCFYKIGNALFCGKGINSAYIAGDLIYLIDTVNNAILPVNGRPTNIISTWSAFAYSVPMIGRDNFFLTVHNGYITDNKSGVLMNPFMLSTINNLSEPVTKTSDMTMKITYTLTGNLNPQVNE